VVLLGGSNMTRGISTLVETARLVCGGPVEILAAIGHGRSYGASSVFCGRTLPGIVECGVWDALQRPSEAAKSAGIPEPREEDRSSRGFRQGSAPQTVALVSDIGNDVLYGASAPQIAGWVETCLTRLAAADARTVMTLLPICNMPKLTPWKYRFFRTLFFPSSRLTRDDVISTATELNERVRELGARHGVTLVEPRAECYGFDPIHVLGRQRPASWLEMMSPWTDAQPTVPARGSLRRYLRLRPCRAERYWVFGRERHTQQPACRMPDGSTLSLY
jgi:hypothetical protein